jgi:dCMP deaminase
MSSLKEKIQILIQQGADLNEIILPKGCVIAECEICHKKWPTPHYYITRTCSRECGAKINHASSYDESKWTVVKCFECGIEIVRRKIHVGQHSFCSRKCLSVGFAKLHKTHNVKENMARGIKRGIYVTRDNRSIKYDSSYELRRMREYDYLLSDELESWERCNLTIPYYDVDNKLRHYNPDFLLKYYDGKIVIEEVKGKIDELAVIKHDALVEFCSKQEGWFEARLFSLSNFDERLEIKTKVYSNDYGIFSRPTLEYIFMSMACNLAERSTCIRKKVGAVFTDALMERVYCFGYNGDEIGGKNQCESLKPGKCNCIHAEINALTKNNFDITGCTCFITLAPCTVCAKVLVNRRVKRVVYFEAYRDSSGIKLLLQRGVEVIKYANLVDSASDIL